MSKKTGVFDVELDLQNVLHGDNPNAKKKDMIPLCNYYPFNKADTPNVENGRLPYHFFHTNKIPCISLYLVFPHGNI